MLTIRQNLLETMTGGRPDRFVKQYEFLELITEAPLRERSFATGQDATDGWGITWTWPEGQIGPMPVHNAEQIVIQDVTAWQNDLRVPALNRSERAWAPAIAHAEAVNRDEKYVAVFVAPGLFELGLKEDKLRLQLLVLRAHFARNLQQLLLNGNLVADLLQRFPVSEELLFGQLLMAAHVDLHGISSLC